MRLARTLVGSCRVSSSLWQLLNLRFTNLGIVGASGSGERTRMKGNSDIGMRKHGRSGRSGKSPKLRLAMRREAEKDERRRKKYPMVESISELLRKR